ncbi:MAG: LuxR C-terminal-related transcriptional regulator [Chloroflexales bacterium]|nr:LuxR C-terminal-related transcriptional regulator [Chloroflexales bacterium]
MYQSRPIVDGDILHDPKHNPPHIRLATPDWFTWLETHNSFTFRSAKGHFTARKERGSSRSVYWKAYRSTSGKLRTFYLGRSATLTSERLELAARELAAHTQVAPTPSTAQLSPMSSVAGSDVHETILRARITVPLTGCVLVRRETPLALLHADEQTVALLTAPAGYGKTSLLVEWIRTDQRTAAWVTLSADERSPQRFWSIVAAALDLVQPEIGARARQRLIGDNPSPVAARITLLNDLWERLRPDSQDRPVLLVLDDYHLLDATNLHSDVALLIEQRPPTLRVVIASRTEPPLPLPRLRVRGQLTQLDAADLAFQPSEVGAVLELTTGRTFSAEQVTAITAWSEGWIAAIRLAALALRASPTTDALARSLDSSKRQVSEYLLTEALAQQSAPVQQVLLHTAVLDSFCTELCAALLAETDAVPSTPEPARLAVTQEVIERIAAAGLFLTPLDQEGRWLRYHRLFAETLRFHLRQIAPEHEARLRSAASAWFEQQGFVHTAIEQALLANDWPRATRLIESEADVCLQCAGIDRLDRWLAALPQQFIRERPMLTLVRALLWALENRFDQVCVCLDDLEDRVRRSEIAIELELLGRINVLRLMEACYRLDIQRGRSAAVIANQQLASESSWRIILLVERASLASISDQHNDARHLSAETIRLGKRIEFYGSALVAIGLDAAILIDQGQLKLAERQLQEARRCVAEWGVEDLPENTALDYAQGLLLYHRNDLDSAAWWLEQSLAHARQGRLYVRAGHSARALAVVYLAAGDQQRALAACNQSEAAFEPEAVWSRDRFDWMHAFVAVQRVSVALAATDTVAVTEFVRQVTKLLQIDGMTEATNVKAVVLIAMARCHLFLGDLSAADELLAAERSIAEHVGAHLRLIEISLLQAQVAERQGDRDTALMTLRQALERAAPEGFERILLDAGAALLPLLDQLATYGAQRTYAAQLRMMIINERRHREPRCIMASTPREPIVTAGELERAVDAPPRLAVMATEPSRARSEHVDESRDQSLVEPLTTREFEVLHAINTGCSNDEIAQMLTITVHTVKWHLRSIYGKFGVQRRTQALARARSLGLLD